MATQKTDSGQYAVLQIVDFSAGAKMRVISRVAAGSPPGTPDTKFEKRTTSEWDSWIRTNANSASLPASRLFSEVNASFFIDANPLHSTTALSMPEMTGSSIRSTGYALTHQDDPAWNRTKASLVFYSPSFTPQSFRARAFPAHYSAAGVASEFAQGTDGLVAFNSLAGDTVKEDPRTMVGYSGSRLYILTTQAKITLVEADAILGAAGSALEVQLDGGCSTQFYSKPMVDAHVGIGIPACRNVPDVLAVWMAP